MRHDVRLNLRNAEAAHKQSTQLSVSCQVNQPYQPIDTVTSLETLRLLTYLYIYDLSLYCPLACLMMSVCLSVCLSLLFVCPVCLPVYLSACLFLYASDVCVLSCSKAI